MRDLKTQIVLALSAWVSQRPGLDYGNYGDWTAYRAEMRSIRKDLQHARAMINYVAWHDSITAEMILDAADNGGRLSITIVRDRECMTCKHEWTAPVTYGATANLSGEQTCYCPKCNSRATVSMPQRVQIDYCTGQYWPTEYRPAVCRLMSSVIWHWLSANMPKPVHMHNSETGEDVQRIDGLRIGDYLRKTATLELGASIARRWFA